MNKEDLLQFLMLYKGGEHAQFDAALNHYKLTKQELAQQLLNNELIDQQYYYKMSGITPPKPPSPDDIAFENFMNDLRNGYLNDSQLHTNYPDHRYNDAVRSHISSSISRMSDREIKQYYKSGMLDDNQVRAHLANVGRMAQFDELLDKPKGILNIPEHLWPKTPFLTYGNTDVLVIGTPGAGKTMFLAAFYKYANDVEGNLDRDAENSTGYQYCGLLINAINKGNFVQGTPNDVVLYTSATLKTTETKRGLFGSKEVEAECPMNFVEMSGETFVRAYNRVQGGMPENLKYCLEDSINPKILVLTLPVNEADVSIDGVSYDGVEIYNYTINYLESKGIFKKVAGVALVITKCDLQNDVDLDDFIAKRCAGLSNKLEDLADKYKFDYEEFAFCLDNNVNVERNTYNFDPTTTVPIYNWLLETAPLR